MNKWFLKNFTYKKVFVTTPIFYVNSKPHIGHLYSAVLASAVKQVNKLNNVETVLSTGTDEHGLKVQQKARDEKVEVKVLCDKNSKLFKDLFDSAKIEYDYFIRTSDEEHKKYTHSFWENLVVRNKIKKENYSGYYSVQEESYVPEKDLVKKDGKFYTSLSVLSNQPVEYLTEENYQINFTKEDIEEFLKLINEEKINYIPKSILNEVKAYINANVMNFCVSRPKKRVSWGIEVPKDDSEVIYVWFEALLNYLTIASSELKENFNPENIEFIHIIGKDISKFHCYIWPLLLILNKMFPFKLTVLMHNYWLKNESKMSKSIGNVVDPDKVIKKFGVDAVRYYFLAAGPLLHDVNFEEKALTNVFYRNIPDSFINLILRVSNSKLMNANDYNKNERFSNELINKISENMKNVENAKRELNNYNFVQAAHYMHLVLLNLNNVVHSSEFWKKTEDTNLISQIFCFTIEFIRILTILYKPFLPELMANVAKFIGVKENDLIFNNCFFRLKDKDTFESIYREINLNYIPYNDTINEEGYYNINLDYRSAIFINKVKI